MPPGVPRVPEPREWILVRACAGPCGETKPWALFSPKTYWPDGRVRTVQSYCRACHPSRNREYHRKWQRENREHRNAYNRERDHHHRALRAEQATQNGAAGGRLPIGPLREFLNRVLEEEQADLSALAVRCGLDEATLRRVKNSLNWIGLVQADRIITRLGGQLDFVYPYEGSEAA